MTDVSAAAAPSASSARADWAVSCVASSSGPSLSSLRIEARKRNGHAMDPISDGLVILEQEHDAISAGMTAVVQRAEQWVTHKQGEPQEVDKLLSQLVALVAQHASLEERYVYPLFQSHLKGEVQGITSSMIYERNVVDDNVNKQMLDLLLQMKLAKDGELMLATLKKFQMIEEEHLTQEEHWFALLRSQMQVSDLRALADKMRSAASTAPTLPHSFVGPSHAMLAQLAHPVAGILDRVHDKAVGRDIGLETREGGAKQIKAVPAEEQKQ